MKKIISFILAILLLLNLVPTQTVNAADNISLLEKNNEDEIEMLKLYNSLSEQNKGRTKERMEILIEKQERIKSEKIN